MAVSDYTVDYVSNEERYKNYLLTSNYNALEMDRDSKISSYEDNLLIKLKRTPKVIEMIKNISSETYLVGFKLLDNVNEENILTYDKLIKVGENELENGNDEYLNTLVTTLQRLLTSSSNIITRNY